jgi:myo-inositol-1(or 4)-monophosphatase
MLNINVNELGSFATKLAKEAGRLSIVLREKPLELQTKRSASDLVTFVDKYIEEYLINEILKKYPDHGVIGEEGTFKKDISNTETVWIIDPIDGTTNFVHDRGHYAISIAIVHKDIELIGIVYDPIHDELFYGEKDKGAFYNDKKIEITSKSSIQESLIGVIMFWDNPKTKEQMDSRIIKLARDSRGLRINGCASLDICHVALGRLDAYISAILQPWDFAGGKIFLEQAGGLVTHIGGDKINIKSQGSIVACNPGIQKKLLSILEN